MYWQAHLESLVRLWMHEFPGSWPLLNFIVVSPEIEQEKKYTQQIDSILSWTMDHIELLHHVLPLTS